MHTGYLQIGFVKGVDLSPGEIQEARRRFEEHAQQRNPRQQGRSCPCSDSTFPHFLSLSLPCYQPSSYWCSGEGYEGQVLPEQVS